MRRIMAIGGVMAGSYAELEDDQKDHHFRQYIPMANRAADERENYVKMQHYTRRVIHTPNGDIEFLAPIAWSDWQALQSALGGSFAP